MRTFILSICVSFFVLNTQADAAVVSGELKKWHRVTLTFDGPTTDENAAPNPFRDYRLNVTFTNGAQNTTVPGYYATDGNAADTSATAGNKWRVHFIPNAEGIWNYTASFRIGTDVAVDTDPNAGTPTAFDGENGNFSIGITDKTGSDFRGKGLLCYVSDHHLRFNETGEYYLKGGADSPENFLGYYEFDGTYDTGGLIADFLHEYQPHAGDWNTGDPTWQGGKGKNIIGALNYLAGQGMNSTYFITYNIDGGDGADTWPWISHTSRDRFDCSKLDQWEIVFSHMDKLGIQLHFLTQEVENDQDLDGGLLGTTRKLYYREMISRFAHHLALQWNLGEENNNTDAQRKNFAQYIRTLDPYDHPITVHSHGNTADTFYNGLLGADNFEATSIQGSADQYNHWAESLRRRSAQHGRRWCIYGDEQGPAVEDDVSNLDQLRKEALWGNLVGGGAGVEWYFGYQGSFGDVQSEDWRVAEPLWEDTRHALTFFQQNFPFAQMEPRNSLVCGTSGALALNKPGEIYAVFLPSGGSPNLNVAAATYNVKWFNPRSGGGLMDGPVTEVTGPGFVSLGQPPNATSSDWAILVQVAGSPTKYTLAVNSGDGDGDYIPNSVVGILADVPPENKVFDQWTGDIAYVDNISSPSTFIAMPSADVNVTATYEDAPAGPTVQNFTLINADTDQPITAFDPMIDGATLNLQTLPTRNLNVRANTYPATVGSVKFGWDANPDYRIENVAPYALEGDTNGDYNAWTPSVGTHTLTATSYSESGGGGTAGTAKSIQFSVIDQEPNDPPSVGLTAPADGDWFVAPADITIEVTALDVDGSVVQVDFKAEGNLIGSDNTAPFEMVWPDVTVGEYMLTAKATDDDEAVTESLPVEISVRPVGDFDDDGDVDLEDFGIYQLYLGLLASDCPQADLDGDGFIDNEDTDIIKNCISGPDVPADPACANQT